MIILSILIPAYEYRNGIQRILSGIIECDINDLKKIEIIIGDDSKEKIINNKEINFYKKVIPNFQYIFNKKKNSINNWNNLIKISRGEFFWLLHHDEIINNPKKSIKNILNHLSIKKKIYLLPLFKSKTYKFLLSKLIISTQHTPNNKLIKFFIDNSFLFFYFNILGPPSSLIVSSQIDIKYRNDLKWLVDVDYYYRIFKFINFKKVKIFSSKDIKLISDQDFKNSITKRTSQNRDLFSKISKDEKLKVIDLYNLKKQKALLLIYLFFKYKINYFLKKRISLKISNSRLLNK